MTPHLTVSYGLRWDNFGNPSAYGADVEPFANVKLGAGGDLRSQVSALSVGAVNNVYSSSRKGNFLPRGSVAYSLPHAGLQTVVRAGIGLYQDDLNLANVTANLPTQAPVRLSITRYPFSPYTFGNTTVHGPVGTLNPYGFQLPNIVVSSYSAKGAPLDASGNVIGGVNLYGADPDLKPQSVLIYNAGIEQEMPRKLVVGINYSGSHGYDQLLTSNVNTYTNRGSAPAINTDFGRITFFRNAGVSNYNALILTARQALGKLTYQTSYTWSKSLSDPTANLTDQYNVPSQYSYTAADVRQRFTLTQVYEVPSRFGSRYLNLALARWSLNNTLTTQSGTPFSLEAANQNDSSSLDYNNDGQLADIPLYTGTKRNFNRSDARKSITDSTSLFAAGSLVAPAVGSEGEGGKQYTFRGPGYFDLDSGVSKKIDLPWFFGEKATLSLRFQAINLLNTANFGNPDQELGDNTAGQVRAAYNSRKVQFGGRFEF